mmetsp:Transcript_20828/g.37107  ORF Transcript_20828/g.37107 Transcript_20828/m.37107 type:complete len:241 (-) Transcript_20828:320-1042(-)
MQLDLASPSQLTHPPVSRKSKDRGQRSVQVQQVVNANVSHHPHLTNLSPSSNVQGEEQQRTCATSVENSYRARVLSINTSSSTVESSRSSVNCVRNDSSKADISADTSKRTREPSRFNVHSATVNSLTNRLLRNISNGIVARICYSVESAKSSFDTVPAYAPISAYTVVCDLTAAVGAEDDFFRKRICLHILKLTDRVGGGQLRLWWSLILIIRITRLNERNPRNELHIYLHIFNISTLM